jgi:hypothetical protein
MRATNRKLLLLITAFVEAATGLCLFILPAVVFWLLLGLEQATADALFVGRHRGRIATRHRRRKLDSEG